jgi:hypothetical protein
METAELGEATERETHRFVFAALFFRPLFSSRFITSRCILSPSKSKCQRFDDSSHAVLFCLVPIFKYWASKSNISIIQRSQSKILRMTVDAPWYVSNATLHADLGISYVQDAIHQKCNKHHTTLETRENPLRKTLQVRKENRRLKRNWPIDLI